MRQSWLCTHHACIRENGSIAPLVLTFGCRRKWVVGLRLPIEWRAEWVPVLVWSLWRREQFLASFWEPNIVFCRCFMCSFSRRSRQVEILDNDFSSAIEITLTHSRCRTDILRNAITLRTDKDCARATGFGWDKALRKFQHVTFDSSAFDHGRFFRLWNVVMELCC
jgi:hypothetical protein